ncbi:unnamed protein product [Amoebophrya sp. A25]|nr:unnamed protein product [Amoebophrya sp. A25]|eukprot:GSA25T00015839001.1
MKPSKNKFRLVVVPFFCVIYFRRSLRCPEENATIISRKNN